MFNYQRVLHCYFLSASLGFASGKHAKTAAMGHISSPHCHEPSQEPTMRCQNKHHLYVRGINNNTSIKEMVLRFIHIRPSKTSPLRPEMMKLQGLPLVQDGIRWNQWIGLPTCKLYKNGWKYYEIFQSVRHPTNSNWFTTLRH